MGVLDDAIRAHIELKRKHGADEQELERNEAEALGPVRREAPADELDEEQLEADGETVEEADGAAGQVAGEQVEPESYERPEPDPRAQEPEPVAHEADDIFAEPEFFETGEPEVAETALESEGGIEPAEVHGDTPTQGFDALADPAPPPAASEGAEADVLEETPEFLEETPEHDRLWFEQKPPRDFDFDDQ